jgi:hypothetical protein
MLCHQHEMSRSPECCCDSDTGEGAARPAAPSRPVTSFGRLASSELILRWCGYREVISENKMDYPIPAWDDRGKALAC